ncbi:MAG: hypothetical protein WCO04_14540 [Pseudomonadota bacterium]
MELLVVLIISSLISALVGYFIDESSGALWGFFLGPIGWIIAAILKEKNGKVQDEYLRKDLFVSRQVQSVATIIPVKPSSDKEDLRKWTILKEVDADIRAASERVVELEPQLDSVLAEKYFALNDKQYLQSLTELVINVHKKHLEAEAAVTANVAADEIERSKRSKRLYEMSLGPDRIAPETGGRVTSVEIYHGSWVPFKGGIRIVHDDGRNMLLNNSLRRTFPAGDNGWQ